MASQWFDIDQISTLEYDDDGIPDNHTITVNDRHVSIDAPTLIQNNVKTETITLSLDDEWNDMLVTVLLGSGHNCVELQWLGTPLTIPASVMEDTGGIDVSVVGLNDDGTVRLVTAAATDAFNVVASGLVHGSTPVDDPEDLTAQLLAAAESATEAATAANDAASSASTAASSASSAASAANTAAEAANEAAQSANDAAERAESAYDAITTGNVLKRTLGPDAVLTADDAFAAVPLGLKVYGNTRQNLWVNPSGSSSGVAVTSNDNGSITISGTPTSTPSFRTEAVYVLKPGATYTAAIDRNTPTGVVFSVVLKRADDSTIQQVAFGRSGQSTSATFTVPSSDFAYVKFDVYFNSEATSTSVSGTYRVMLNEGSEAEPWCPPGLNSIESIEIVMAGKNLLPTTPEVSSVPTNGITFTTNADGSIHIEGTGAVTYQQIVVFNDLHLPEGISITAGSTTTGVMPNAYAILYGIIDTDFIGITTSRKDAPKSGTTDAKYKYYRLVIVAEGNEAVYDGDIYFWLERGSTATDYEPPNVTAIPIDLQGHTLNALPDGTRDDLHIDGGGNVVLEKRVVVATAPTDAGSWSWESVSERATFSLPSAGPTPQPDETSWLLCDKLPVRDGTSAGETSYVIVGNTIAYAKNPAITSTTTAATVAGGATYIYPLAEPQTIDLGAITLPTLPAPNVTAYASANVEAESEMEYIRDVNVVCAKQDARIAALEEAVAANTLDIAAS